MAKQKVFQFTGPLENVKKALIHTVIYLPDEVMKTLPAQRHRVKGTMNGVPFALAIQYRKEGNSFFIVGNALRKSIKAKPGDQVMVSFRIVDPEKVDMPEELEAVLAQDEEGMRAWSEITIGLQRSLIIYINGVKNVDSKIKRALFIVNKAKHGFYTKEAVNKRNKPKE
jgi:hypothetical protein